MTADVVIIIYNGIIESVKVFRTDGKNSEQKALNYLSECLNENIGSVDDFRKWQEEHQGSSYEYYWTEAKIE